jgi:hypothetical protein
MLETSFGMWLCRARNCETSQVLALTGELTKSLAQSTPRRPCVEASQPHHKPHPLRTRRVFMLSAKIPPKPRWKASTAPAEDCVHSSITQSSSKR